MNNGRMTKNLVDKYNFVVAFQYLTNEKRSRQLLKHCVITVQYGEDGKKILVNVCDGIHLNFVASENNQDKLI
jgi:hypothetical protein